MVKQQVFNSLMTGYVPGRGDQPPPPSSSQFRDPAQMFSKKG